MRRFGILIAIFLIGVTTFWGLTSFVIYQYRRPGPLLVAKNIVIPKGNNKIVLERLQTEAVLSKGQFTTWLFQAAVYFTRSQGALHAAELTFPQHVSMQQALSILRHAPPVQHEITIPEGLTAFQIEKIINKAPFMQGQINLNEEARILPQTYKYEWGTSRQQILTRMENAMQKKLQVIWQNRENNAEIKSPRDLMTLASIIEKETALANERPKIARVFINRLQLNMKLQSDPTVIFALTQGKTALDRPLQHADLNIASPYNTYWVKGLPAGPICSPGEASLNAAAHPYNGDMLYFVANSTGGHNFAKTLDEHNRNVAIYRQENQKNKKP
ncbi:MAG: endolytic transglycosylase MltG [Commensalibacter sp.]|nr:endolytic transglycosylase MltG [Commensalibacter sp.]